ncbi:putative E3 ubiquitin-protein ligase CCNB1IP1 [Septoria linicola]|nr:putative E3 ubiquitin-protein ligase CCNB1IP1 [Septoria linicola]
MDSTLKCNDLACRGLCPDQAVVTTCSHIFCLSCAGRLGLVEVPRDGYRICPACSTQLMNPDDAVVTSLNPAEDYKTSILSGLSPMIIMECAGRGLAFWAYQMVQEITYQDYMTRSLTEKYQGLEAGMAETERTLREQNDKLNNTLKGKQQTGRNAACSDNEALHHKNEGLVQQLQQRNKSYQQMHTLYNKLKHQQQAAGLELAADQGAEQILMQAGSQQQPQHRMSTQRPDGQAQQRVRNGSNGSGGSDERRQQRVHSWPQATQPTYSQQTNTGMGYQSGAGGSYRSAVGTSHSMPIPPGSSQNRVRLPQAYSRPAFGTYNQSLLGGGFRSSMGNDPLRTGTPSQGQYNGVTTNTNHVQNGAYGMSAGMRMGRPAGISASQSRGLHANSLGAGYAGMTMH